MKVLRKEFLEGVAVQGKRRLYKAVKSGGSKGEDLATKHRAKKSVYRAM